jgi:hypothetical protein
MAGVEIETKAVKLLGATGRHLPPYLIKTDNTTDNNNILLINLILILLIVSQKRRLRIT